MKRIAGLVLVMAGALFCLGMGGLGGSPEGTIPETDVEIEAKVFDHSGMGTTLKQFSMDGKTYLDAMRGSGQLAVPFQQLALVTCGKVNGDDLAVQVKLKSGSTMELTVRKRAVFYGSTDFGTFTIKARDVARIEFP